MLKKPLQIRRIVALGLVGLLLSLPLWRGAETPPVELGGAWPYEATCYAAARRRSRTRISSKLGASSPLARQRRKRA